MAATIQVQDASGNVVFDTEGMRIAGGVQITNTGQANGSYTATVAGNQSVQFVFNLPESWLPAGVASRWPSISVSGNTVSWTFNPNVATGDRTSVPIYVVRY